MKPLKERISITIDGDLLEKLKEKADEDCRPLSQYINLVLRKHVEQEEKQRNAIVPNKKQFVTNVKKMFQMIPIVIILAVIFAFIKLLQRKRKWNQMTNKEKVLFYEKQLEKYAENGAKSRNNSNSMTSEIIEKARYSNKDITRHELNLVKRHLDLLKRKNGNVTKILTKLK